jgi:hypothetical protein
MNDQSHWELMLPDCRRSNLLVVALSSLEKMMHLRAASVSRGAPIVGSHTLVYVSNHGYAFDVVTLATS